MKHLISTLLLIFTFICTSSQVMPVRQRNMIYVLDCTASMNGYNNAPNIWPPTVDFLHQELEKERLYNPTAKITILPFQDKVLEPLRFEAKNYDWDFIQDALNKRIGQITATNICDAWIDAETHIDPTCNNYIVLMTDGQDNIGGSANAHNRMRTLMDIFERFCGKYDNTKGFYLELTTAATLPDNVKRVVDICNDLIIVDASHGLYDFGTIAPSNADINTRDLPADIRLSFSNSGKYNVALTDTVNDFVRLTVINDSICGGQLTIHVESKYGDDITMLNGKMNDNDAEISFRIESTDVDVQNPEFDLRLCNTPLRSLDIGDNIIGSDKADRVQPFLWIKGNGSETLSWNLQPRFNDSAIADDAYAKFRLKPATDISGCDITVNGVALYDSCFYVRPHEPAIVEMTVPDSYADADIRLNLQLISLGNLDRINGQRTFSNPIVLHGEATSHVSWLKYVVFILLGILIIAAIAWFAWLKQRIFPKFKKGTVTIQSPYFATINLKGCRKVVLSSSRKSQGFLSRIFTGRVMYHCNSAWTSIAELTPTVNQNAYFKCPSRTLMCSPSSIWSSFSGYSITDTNNNNTITVFKQ